MYIHFKPGEPTRLRKLTRNDNKIRKKKKKIGKYTTLCGGNGTTDFISKPFNVHFTLFGCIICIKYVYSY